VSEVFNTPSPVNSLLLITEINSAGFPKVLVNKLTTIVPDAVVGDRSTIQAVIDSHNPNSLTVVDQAKVDLLALDLGSLLTAPVVETAVKNIIHVLRGQGLLK